MENQNQELKKINNKILKLENQLSEIKEKEGKLLCPYCNTIYNNINELGYGPDFSSYECVECCKDVFYDEKNEKLLKEDPHSLLWYLFH